MSLTMASSIPDRTLKEGSENCNVGAHSEIGSRSDFFSDSLLTNALSEVEEALRECIEIESQIRTIHNSVRDCYRTKFPELDSLVHHPIDYVRVVKRIGNETDLTLVDFDGILPSAIIMVVSITASTTSGSPLSQENLRKTIDACDRALLLDEKKHKLLGFIESRMAFTAPNLSAIVGSAVAAKLIGAAGGLPELASMPACNFQLIGFNQTSLAGFSSTSQLRIGYIQETDIFKMTPPSLAMRACQLVAEKSALAARVDYARAYPTGEYGRNLKQKIQDKIVKWQEPPPAKRAKPLPVPDSKSKKKRGGRRLRKMRERYAVTDMRRLANRMLFGVPEESSLGDGLGEGYGMFCQVGNGKLRVPVVQQSSRCPEREQKALYRRSKKPVDPMQKALRNERLNKQGFMPLPTPSSRNSELSKLIVSSSPNSLQNGHSGTKQSGNAIAQPEK